MQTPRTYALFYQYHPTREYVMVTVPSESLVASVFDGRRELRALVGESYRPDSFTLARTFEVPR